MSSHQTNGQGPLWYLADPEEIGAATVSMARGLLDQQAERYDWTKLRLAAYEGRTIESLTPAAYRGNPAREATCQYQIAKSVVDAAKAKIASRQRPKCVALSNGGNYSDRIRAKKLSRLMGAPLDKRHGKFPNAHALSEAVFKDCCLSPRGYIKVRADLTERRPIYERVHWHQILHDDTDAHDGTPQTRVHVYRADRGLLREMFPDCAEAIDGASTKLLYGEVSPDVEGDIADRVVVFEAWRLPLGPNKPGRWVIAVDAGQGCQSSCALVDREYTRPGFPFAAIEYEPNQFGVDGTPLIDQVIEPQSDYNEIAGWLKLNAKLVSGGFVAVPKGSVAEDQLVANDHLKIVEYNPSTQPPQVHMPSPFHPALREWMEDKRGLCFQLPGVNEMASQGRKEPGINAAVAIRAQNDQQSERFLPKSRAYESLFVQLGELTLWAYEDLAEEFGDSIEALEINNYGTTSIKWEDVKLQSYTVTLAPASASADTLAGRLQRLEEWGQSGFISPTAYKRLSVNGNIDMEALAQRETAQARLIERIIGQIEEATEDTTRADIEPPNPIMNLPLAIASMSDAYLEMLSEEAPEYVTRLALDWITEADQLLNTAAPEPEPAPAQLSGAPMPPQGPMGV